MTREQEIRELQLKRLALLEEYGLDRLNPELIKKEREILKQIERLTYSEAD